MLTFKNQKKVEKAIGEKSAERANEEQPDEQISHCLLCGQMGPAILYGHWICDHCQNVVQAEAVAQNRKIVKEGGGPPSGP